nr:coat protein p42 [Southern tomato virus]
MAGVGGSAAGRVPNAANVPLTAKEKERTVMREIVEIGETFVELGIDKRYFQRTTYVSHMLLPNQYFKLLKQFKGKTAEELDLALGAAVAHGVLRSMRGITFKKFFDFLNWVKTKEGKDALGETMYAQKLEQKGRGDFSIAEVALLHCFETQRNDMLRDEKDVRLKAEEEIADLQRKIVKRREKLEEDLIATKSNYEPVSRYVGLSDYELNCKCWSLYQQFNPDKVTAGAKPTRKQVKEAFDMYAEFVAKTNRLEFLKHGNVKGELQAFINAKILGYEQLGDKGKSRYLRRQLAAMGVEMDHEVESEDEEEAAEEPAGGEAEEGEGDDPLQATVGDNPDGEARGEEDTAVQVASPAVTRNRGRGRGRVTPLSQRKDRG